MIIIITLKELYISLSIFDYTSNKINIKENTFVYINNKLLQNQTIYTVI